jgi:hypothetical protein
MLCMGRCWACDGELDPAWKFCVHCGIPIERDEVPSAIRVLLIGGGVLALLYFA